MELREVTVLNLTYSVEDAMREATAAFGVASEKDDSKGMVSAVMLKAKLKGLIVDRKEVGDPGDFSHLTDAELDEQLTRERAATEAAQRAIRIAKGEAAGAGTAAREKRKARAA